MATHQYSGLSIVLHWVTAVAIVALFISHEGSRDSAMFAFHVSGGALLGIVLLWRVLRRSLRGFADKPDQPALLNLASTLVMWALLLSIFTVAITGYLLPWTQGRSLDIFGVISIPSFMGDIPWLHNLTDRIHNLSGHLLLPLTLLHVLGAFKHLIFDRDGVMQRIFKADKDGR